MRLAEQLLKFSFNIQIFNWIGFLVVVIISCAGVQ